MILLLRALDPLQFMFMMVCNINAPLLLALPNSLFDSSNSFITSSSHEVSNQRRHCQVIGWLLCSFVTWYDMLSSHDIRIIVCRSSANPPPIHNGRNAKTCSRSINVSMVALWHVLRPRLGHVAVTSILWILVPICYRGKGTSDAI